MIEFYTHFALFINSVIAIALFAFGGWFVWKKAGQEQSSDATVAVEYPVGHGKEEKITGQTMPEKQKEEPLTVSMGTRDKTVDIGWMRKQDSRGELEEDTDAVLKKHRGRGIFIGIGVIFLCSGIGVYYAFSSGMFTRSETVSISTLPHKAQEEQREESQGEKQEEQKMQEQKMQEQSDLE